MPVDQPETTMERYYSYDENPPVLSIQSDQKESASDDGEDRKQIELERPPADISAWLNVVLLVPPSLPPPPLFYWW